LEPESRSGGATAPDPPSAPSIEAEILLQVVRTVDRWYVGVQDLARSVGILGSGRESIREYEAEGLRYAEFPDLDDEGWPGFRMVLPSEATFSHATSGVFYRGAHFRSDLVREELVVRYKAALLDDGLRYESRDDPVEDFLRTGDLGGDVRIRITGSRRGHTTISIGQYRDRANVEAAIRKAAERMRSDKTDGDPPESVDA
jgi:hypothetical protein